MIICNFDLWALGTGIDVGGIHGHISPIAAYHEESDRVLLLDTFTEETWVKIESLYNAMSTPSDETNESKGYIVIDQPPVWSEHKESISNREDSHREDSNREDSTHSVPSEGSKPFMRRTPSQIQNNPKRRASLRRTSSTHSVDFSIVFDAKQNYNESMQQPLAAPKRKLQRRASRRMSKKLRLFMEFDDSNGQELWKETQSSEYHQKYIVVEYFEQHQATMDGMVSMAIVFNARSTAHYHSNEDHKIDDEMAKWTEESVATLYEEHRDQNKGECPRGVSSNVI